jgi:hypothetical protein
VQVGPDSADDDLAGVQPDANLDGHPVRAEDTLTVTVWLWLVEDLPNRGEQFPDADWLSPETVESSGHDSRSVLGHVFNNEDQLIRHVALGS